MLQPEGDRPVFPSPPLRLVLVRHRKAFGMEQHFIKDIATANNFSIAPADLDRQLQRLVMLRSRYRSTPPPN